MLQVSHLSLLHRKDLRPLIGDLSFTLHAGEKMAVIGEEGNGKSTLLKAIADPRSIESYIEQSGSVFYGNHRIGYLPQEFPKAQEDQSIYDWFSAAEGFWDRTPAELSEIGRPMGLSLSFFYSDQIISTLSGGEKVKLQAAALLIAKPDLLLLDEPTNDLDLDTLIWLEGFIKNCPQAVLYISHDETLLEKTADAILHLELLRRKTLPRWTLRREDYRTYLAGRSRAFAHQEQVARKEEADFQRKMERYRQIEQKVEHAQNAISRGDPHGGRLLKKKMHAVKAMGNRLEKESRTELPDVEDAIFVRFEESISMPQGKRVLDFSREVLKTEERILSVSPRLIVNGPEHIGIVGPNGCGKTTMLRLIAEELQKRRDIKAFYMPQRYEETADLSQTPVEWLSKTYDHEEQSRIRTYLGSMKYTPEEMEHVIADLSGGQKAKLFFIKMNLEKADVLILDEPTRNFSPLSNPILREVLKNYRGTILSVSHDRKFLKEVCTKLYRLTPEGLLPYTLPE